MKKFILNIIISSGVILLFITSCNKQNEPIHNLIINGSAERPRHDSIPGGWTNVKGNWRSVKGDSITHAYALAQNGKYLFFEGQDSLGILQQDINLEKYAGGINAHKQQFIFIGYLRSYLQYPPDQTIITIMCLDKSKSKQLYTFSSDTISSVSEWQKVTESLIAPVYTRFIRVQLIAHRRNGLDNDGYFDNITLTATPVENNLSLSLFIAGSICVIAIILWVVIKQRKNKKVAQIKS